MKKNKALTAAISVLSLTMVSMCAIGGTFAKYTTTGSDSETAKVAKWGVNITAAADSAFADEKDDGVETDVVTSSYIVAPGTYGTLVDIKVTGQPEVAVTVSSVATFDLTGDWTIDDDGLPGTDEVFYCPIVFEVNDVEVTGTSETDLEAKIIAALTYNATLNPNSSLATTYDRKLTWSWAYRVDDLTDKKDTLLGNNEPEPGFTVSVTTTVTQVD